LLYNFLEGFLGEFGFEKRILGFLNLFSSEKQITNENTLINKSPSNELLIWKGK
jgi:hypothetical protein